MLKQEPPRRPFGWQYTEPVQEQPGKAVVDAPQEPARVPVAPDADAPLSPEQTETLAAQIVPLQTGTPVTPLKPKARKTEEK